MLLAKHPNAIRGQGPRCGVEKSGRADLIDALSARGATRAAIGRILKAEGIPVSYGMVDHHLSGNCRCKR